ncbi:MAG: multiubiquitin domain-containing protein [Gammaproteobacteria bacterium]|nr:multiubiquitin domain-containing protein [Gammaproteobacteria bacterium]
MNSEVTCVRDVGQQTVLVAGLSLAFQETTVPSESPSGAQIAAAAGFKPEQGATVLEFLVNGELEDIRPDEVVGLGRSTRKFLVVQSDRGFKLKVNGTSMEWPAQIISGGQIRKIGQVAADLEVFQELPDGTERELSEHDLVDLGFRDIEAFKTRPRTWILNVQGVLLKVRQPTILVRQAIQDAGFDPDKPWIAVLRVRGEPKREVDLDYVIDLRHPGIEKLRLTPREVNNGEAPSAPRRMFHLLDVDERFLDGLGLLWETIIETDQPNQQRRWLLIDNYPVPPGFTAGHTRLALEIPPTYPGAQIYGFYTSPPLALKAGHPIPSTQLAAVILGVAFNGWSRHRGDQFPWNPAADNVVTHLALVDAAMTRESGE